MCGILGIVGHNIKQAYNQPAIEKMLGTLSKRGPDDHGVLTFSNCILGQTRLSIIDLTGGHQPMKDAQRNLAITFNGEIYNYQELRKKLNDKGYTFSTKSDTEVILKAYQEYGPECPKHLDGMFAFAIWDEEKSQLFMARDRFGKKPLYYTFDDQKNLIVASEIKAILASGCVKSRLSKTALDNYLQLMYVPPTKSIYENIFPLLPAHSAIFENGKLKTKRYWSLEYKPLKISYPDAKQETMRLLEEAVKKRILAADVEVGSFLSGGVDSTFVSLLAQKYLDHPLKTFALGYGDHINELPYAEQAAHIIGSEHFTRQADNSLVEELEKVSEYFDEPHADTSNFPQHLISELAASKVKVALSGDGGDELFMGYGWHTRHLHLSYRAHTVEKLFLNQFQGRVLATQIFSKFQRMALWGGLSNINSDIYVKDAYGSVVDPMQKIIIFDTTTYLPGQLLTKVDRTSMMHGLEMRAPFLDTALAEFVYNLPLEYKSGALGNKLILKDLLSEFMPHDFVYRRKQGFGAPIGKWLREPNMHAYITKKLGAGAEIRSIFRQKTIESMLNDFYKKQNGRNQMRLWTLLCLELWFQSHKKFISDL